MKLNMGCGNRSLPGYTGVDVVKRQATDIVAPAHKVPLPAGAATEILAIHLWEHFYRWECDAVIAEWKRLLQRGGRLVLELPDLVKCCRNVLEGVVGKDPDQLTLWGLYGDPRQADPYMAHRWAWSPASLTDFLAGHGFLDVQEQPTQWHPVGRDRRDMRLEAVRP